MNYLAENVRRLRKARGLSQTQLMRRTKVTSVKRIESGGIQSPHYKNLQALATELETTVSALYAPVPTKRSRA